MNPPNSQNLSLSQQELNKKIQENPTKSEQAGADLWQSIRTIISLQNQAPPLVKVSRDEHLNLSFPQERLWFLDQLEGSNSAYNIPFAFRIEGLLNISALEQSLKEIVQRHEALRTNFSAVDRKPVQAIASTATLTLPVTDLRQLRETERKERVRQLIIKEAEQPFDLSKDSLLRASLLQTNEEEWVLLLTVHHIVFDGWSEGLLFAELATLYEAFSTGKPSPLPELPIQYADFAVWQYQWLQGKFREALLDYWQQQLGNNLRELELPSDFPRPTLSVCRSACQKLQLAQELVSSLKTFSRKEGATLFATLLAAFKVLLHTYTEQEDLFVCSPIANRNRKELKEIIGYFVNLLILRSDLSGNPSFRELLSRVRQVVSGAYAHQDLPMQEIVNSLELGQISLSQVMFAFQNTPRQILQLSGLTVTPLETDNGTADFDLFLSLTEEGGMINCLLKYNTDLFAETAIARLLDHFKLVLENIVVDPEQSISSLLPLSETERQYLLARKANRSVNNQSNSKATTTFAPPRDDVELQLTKIWEKVLGIEPIGIKDNYFELGGQSLLAVRLFAQIEEAFGKNLPLATLLQAPTVEQLADLIRQQGESWLWSPLVTIQPKGFKPPLFCIHGMGGNVLCYRELSNYLGTDQPVYGIQAKGLYDDEEKQKLPTIFEEMAAHYINLIRTIQPEGPYYLAGLSAGGAIAFEMAQQLLAQGQKVAMLAMFETYYPGYPKIMPPIPRLFSLGGYILSDLVPRWIGKGIQLGPKAIIAKVNSKAKPSKQIETKPQARVPSKPVINAHRTPAKPSPNNINYLERSINNLTLFVLRSSPWNYLSNRFLQASTAASIDLALEQVKETITYAQGKYEPKLYQGRITFFRASQQPPGYYVDPQLGWGSIATEGVETYEIPGHHSSIVTSPLLAEKLKVCLEHIQTQQKD
jgi:thioesterase domain-containing protein/acyl carrier protein